MAQHLIWFYGGAYLSSRSKIYLTGLRVKHDANLTLDGSMLAALPVSSGQVQWSSVTLSNTFYARDDTPTTWVMNHQILEVGSMPTSTE